MSGITLGLESDGCEHWEEIKLFLSASLCNNSTSPHMYMQSNEDHIQDLHNRRTYPRHLAEVSFYIYSPHIIQADFPTTVSSRDSRFYDSPPR